MADVFISYARLDKDRVNSFDRALIELGLTVFFDVEGLDGGDTFPDVLDREVKTALAVIGCWTPHALMRDWVKTECTIAMENQTLIPAEFERVNSLDVPAAFYRLQRVDMTTWRGSPDHPGWLALVRAVARKLGRPEVFDRAKAVAELVRAAPGRTFDVRPAEAMAALWKRWEQLSRSPRKDALETLKTDAEGTALAELVASMLADLDRPAAVRLLTGSQALGQPPLRGWRLVRFVGLRAAVIVIALGGAYGAYEIADTRADRAELERDQIASERDAVLLEMEVMQAQLSQLGREGVYQFRARNAFLRDQFANGLAEYFNQLPGNNSPIRSRFYIALSGRTDLFATYGIDTAEKAAAFIGQAAIETGFFRYVSENTNYSAEALTRTFSVYRNQPDLAEAHARKPELIANTVYGNMMGNFEPGDGWKYRGRGFFQVTGRGNYARVSELLGLDLIADPDLMNDPEVALAAAIVLWRTYNLDELAQAENFSAISRAVNRGNPHSSRPAHFEDERIEQSHLALSAFRQLSGVTDISESDTRR